MLVPDSDVCSAGPGHMIYMTQVQLELIKFFFQRNNFL